MDTSVSPIVAGAVASALVAAILALWRWVIVSNRKCEERGIRMEDEIKLTKDLQIVAAKEERTRAEAREERAHERAVHVCAVLEHTTEVTRWAVKHLRRIDPDAALNATPLPSSRLRTPPPLKDDESNFFAEA